MKLTKEEANLCRQWFDALQDLQGITKSCFLQTDDFELARKLYEKVGMRVPDSVSEKINK